jgi:hypothetical protein
MRRSLLLIALILSLVMSTMGALAHAYQHYGESDPLHLPQESGTPCELCTAFVALEYAAEGPHTLLPCIGTVTAASSDCTTSVDAQSFHFFFQRGPPAFL